ncbi:MAG: DoxX family protein [Gammaproteobacteria bacterium]|nr:DoxX family protein [Gammaproteobacteria bacterium]
MNLTVIKQWDLATGNLRNYEGIATLMLRLYLAPVLIQAGWTKFRAFDKTVSWFGNAEWGLGMPFPALMVGLVVLAEMVGGALLLAGLMTRLVTIPLMITMLVAALFVHGQNGWLAIADASSWFADGPIYLDETVMAAPEKLEAARSLLKQHGDYQWLTASGRLVILNNGIEFAATYFIMLLALLFMGGGAYVSLDYWLWRWLKRKSVT